MAYLCVTNVLQYTSSLNFALYCSHSINSGTFVVEKETENHFSEYLGRMSFFLRGGGLGKLGCSQLYDHPSGGKVEKVNPSYITYRNLSNKINSFVHIFEEEG